MFSADHFIWMGICFVVVGTLLFFSLKFKWSYKTATTVIFCIYIWAELFKIATHMFPASRWLGEGATVDKFEGAMYLLPKSLPFQLCSLMIFFVGYLRFGKDQNKIEAIKSFILPVFLIAGTLAVLLGTCLNENNTANLFDSFKDENCGPIQYFLYHGGMIWYGIYLIVTKQVRMGLKPWLGNLLLLLCVFVGAIWVNSFLIIYETNFMFVVAPPAKGLPLLNLDHGWHVYIVHYMCLAVIGTFLFELPGIIKERKQKKLSIANN